MKIPKSLLCYAVLSICISACSNDQKPTQAPIASDSVVISEAEKNSAMDKITSKAIGVDVGFLMSSTNVFVFFDPQCTHCGDLWEASQPLNSKVHFIWIPVAFLGPVSEDVGAHILSASSPASEIKLNESTVRATGKTMAVNIPETDASRKVVQANTALFKTLLSPEKRAGVPFLAYKNALGKVQLSAGAMDTQTLSQFLGVSN